MPFPLLPTWITTDVTQIQPNFLKSQGIRLLMLDFDNTIVPYTRNVPDAGVENWLKEVRDSGLYVCVVSNSKRDRVKIFCKKYGLSCITHAKKPFSKGIRECLEKFRVPAKEAVMVGDQIYTDTLGGGGAGVRTILVKSIHNHTVWLKLRHVAELPFILIAKKRRLPDEKS